MEAEWTLIELEAQWESAWVRWAIDCWHYMPPARRLLLRAVVEALEVSAGTVILPTASAPVNVALRELRRFDGRLLEAFECHPPVAVSSP